MSKIKVNEVNVRYHLHLNKELVDCTFVDVPHNISLISILDTPEMIYTLSSVLPRLCSKRKSNNITVRFNMKYLPYVIPTVAPVRKKGFFSRLFGKRTKSKKHK